MAPQIKNSDYGLYNCFRIASSIG